jgi:hypothetical protein
MTVILRRASTVTAARRRVTVDGNTEPGSVVRGGEPVEADQNLVSLRDFIAGLRAELKAAHEDAEKSGDDGGPKFLFGNVNVEFTVTAKKAAEAKGGVRFYVFELGGGGSVASESTQKVNLVLTPVNADGTAYRVSDSIPDDPQ